MHTLPVADRLWTVRRASIFSPQPRVALLGRRQVFCAANMVDGFGKLSRCTGTDT